ncbi:hypothetical protein [Peteryoungia algae]|uniref:Uncharacterized protein n=1 Tax=Peteryoungia algae TaxID=2919917 RepID=A0ABT0CWA2_9HYPH|nr:hypothetical protein [Rhizobium sp. SSM4.3]MCJ8237407.1 hypothetical protein [Rhizobium sp. SSM4.3]
MTTANIPVPEKFVKMCERHQVTPEHVLQQFIHDLCHLEGSSGSDERLYAQLYYERCGYAFSAQVDEDIVPKRLDEPANTLAAMAGLARPYKHRP